MDFLKYAERKLAATICLPSGGYSEHSGEVDTYLAIPDDVFSECSVGPVIRLGLRLDVTTLQPKAHFGPSEAHVHASFPRASCPQKPPLSANFAISEDLERAMGFEPTTAGAVN